MSWKTRIIKALMSLQVSDWAIGEIKDHRAKQERMARFYRLPADIRCRPAGVDDLSAEWIEAQDAGHGVILYLHGGAYNLGSINTHRELIARLVQAAKTPALAVDYRLAPENPYPAALEDAVNAYRWLMDQGYAPSQIVFAGDSAGSGLALATLVALRDGDEPLPAAAVCISPWTDLACTGESIQGKAKTDPILTPEALARWAKNYGGEYDLKSPLISPLYAELAGLPPLMFQVGTNEVLLDDSTRFVATAREAGVDVTLDIWEDMFHVFQMFAFMPETKKAVRQIANFISKHLKSHIDNDE